MMRWIIGTSLRSRRVVIALAALVMVFGFFELKDMSRDVLPEFTPPTVQVQTEALGLSAVEVEEFITVPLEQDLLNGVAFLDTIRSESLPGLSNIEMIFEPGTDILDARQVVAERLTQAAVGLPGVQSSLPQMLQPLSSTNRVMMIGLSSEELSLIDQSILARWTIRPHLLGVPGVAEVSVWGSRERQLQVLVDPARLRANDVTLQQLVETTANSQFVSPLTFVEASTPGTGGRIETPNQHIGVYHPVPFATAEDLAQVVIPGTNGLELGEVADVVEDHQLLIGDAASPEGPALMLVVEKFPGASPVEVSRGLESALDALRPGLSEVNIDSSLFQPANYLEESNNNLVVALTAGALLLILALGALLYEWRTALASVIAIAASVLAAVLILSYFDVTLNSMVIAGLVLALVVIVDDAVGSARGVAQRLGQQRDAGGGFSPRAIVESLIELRSAALYGALISVIAFVPSFFMSGSFGAFFPSIGMAYGVAVLTSMVVALVITPALASLLLSKASMESRESPVLRWIRPRYERAVARVTGTARPGLVLMAVLLVCGLAALPFMGLSVTPQFEDTNLLVQLEGPPGTSIGEMNRVSSLLANEVRDLPGVHSVAGHTGRALVADQIVGTNSSALWVNLDHEADYDATKASIDEVVAGYPGLDRSVTTYPAERISEILVEPEPQDPVTVRVFGLDLAVLQSKADEVRQLLAGIDGIENPRVQTLPSEPNLEIMVDLDKAKQAGVVPGDVRRAAATLLSGIRVGSLFDEQKVFEVVVWGTPEIRFDLPAVENLPIETREGGRVRLGEVASVRIGENPTFVPHESVSRALDVTAGVSGRDLSAVEADIERQLQAIDFPIEYHAELVPDFSEGLAEDREALWFAVAAVIAIFLLMQTGVGSWRLASVLSVVLPLSLVGGALAILLTGRVVSMGSTAGFLAVLGVAARHAVMQVRHGQSIERREGATFGRELVNRVAQERFPTVLTSAVATALVFAPLAVMGPIAGLELVQPMAVVILGGLVSASLFSLFVVPALHGWLGTSSETDVSVALDEEERTIDLTRTDQPAELTRS
jgi:Cu/Ag efflux pump CusA